MNVEVLLQIVHDYAERAYHAEQRAAALAAQLRALTAERQTETPEAT